MARQDVVNAAAYGLSARPQPVEAATVFYTARIGFSGPAVALNRAVPESLVKAAISAVVVEGW